MKIALFRADGSRHLGWGHIMRCVAFAQGLGKIGVKSLFVIRDYDRRIPEMIYSHGCDVETITRRSSLAEDASLTSKFASRYNANLIVTDVYHRDTMTRLEEYGGYLQALKVAHKFMITIGDSVKTNTPPDIQIVPYYGAENMSYESNGRTKLLLGLAYLIFRQEFIEAAKVGREIRKDAQNILVTMGGSDPTNLTQKVSEALNRLRINSLNLRIVVGQGFVTTIRQALEGILEGFRGNWEVLMGGNNMAELMLWSDVAITGGGLTKYETAVTGTPSIIISQTAHEAEKTREFEREATALHLGLGSEVDEQDIGGAIEKLLGDYALRAEMAERGTNLVDGKGVERIISEIPQEVLL